MSNAHPAWPFVDAHRQPYEALSDRIWDKPELGFAETYAASQHAAQMRAEGFRVTEGIAGMPTALMAEAGEGGPVIAILGEFDALAGLSQEAGVAERRALVEGGSGHGCGHNMLGSGAMLAASAVKDWLAANHRPGRVRYYACPAEEGGSGKLFMARDGAFDDVDIAITWHPGAFAAVGGTVALANLQADFSFIGRASHAAAAPHLGRSALDAVELMNVGVNYMREHMPSSARIHYAYIDAGGIAPNVVQAHATVRYTVRDLELPSVRALFARVVKISEGAALMTETTVSHTLLAGMSSMLPNTPLAETLQKNLDRLGPPPFDEADRTLARRFQATFKPEDYAAAFQRAGIPARPDVALCDVIPPIDVPPPTTLGSSDVGDVSWVVPLVEVRGATWAVGTAGHSWQMVAQGKTPFAKKGMVHAAKAMAATAVDVLSDPALLAAAKADFTARTNGAPYDCPVGPEVKPALDKYSGA